MEEPKAQVTEEQKPVMVEVTKRTKFHWSYVLVVLVLVAGAGAYWWKNDQASKQHAIDMTKLNKLQNQVDALSKAATDSAAQPAKANSAASSAAATSTPATTTVPTAAVKENVIASMKSGNTSALEGYMAASVHVTYAASGGVFDHTPAQAVNDIKYLDSAVKPWDFDLPAATLTGWGSGDYKDYFKANSVVGKSSDGKVILFNFNDAGKVNAVFMSVSADLL